MCLEYTLKFICYLFSSFLGFGDVKNDLNYKR